MEWHRQDLPNINRKVEFWIEGIKGNKVVEIGKKGIFIYYYEEKNHFLTSVNQAIESASDGLTKRLLALLKRRKQRQFPVFFINTSEYYDSGQVLDWEYL